MKGLNTLAIWLLIIGGLNWGLVGVFNYDLIAELLGGGSAAAAIPKIIYIIVGLAALVVIGNQLSGEK